jgi:hypothetical protein
VGKEGVARKAPGFPRCLPYPEYRGSGVEWLGQSGPGTVRLQGEDVQAYIKARFPET